MVVAGPTMWVVLIVLGYALIYWPAMGSGFVATREHDVYSFASAIYISLYSVTTLGLGDYVPTTDFFRLLFASESLVGFCVITLVITFLVEVYNAVHNRNVLTVMMHHRSGNKGDAGALVARLGAHGDFADAGNEIGKMSNLLIELLEHHHSYPITYYFVFEEVHYCIARMTLLSMETATIIRSLLPEEKYGTFTDSGSVAELWGGGKHVVEELAKTFLTPKTIEKHRRESENQRDVWSKRAHAVAKELGRWDIPEPDKLEAAVRRYVELRAQWDHYAKSFAEDSLHDWAEVAPREREL
jgi:hypothetical protein